MKRCFTKKKAKEENKKILSIFIQWEIQTQTTNKIVLHAY